MTFISAVPHRSSTAATTTKPPDRFYVAASDNKKKLYALEYSTASPNYELKRKIKCGKCDDDSAVYAALSPGTGRLCISKGRELRVIAIDNGAKVGKVRLDEVPRGVFWCGGDDCVLVALESILVVYDISKGDEKDGMEVKCRLESSDDGSYGSINSVEVEGNYMLVNGMGLYDLTKGIKIMDLQTESKKTSIVSGHFKSADEVEVIMMTNDNTSDLTAETVSLKTEDGTSLRSDDRVTVGKSATKKRTAEDGIHTDASTTHPELTLGSDAIENLCTREFAASNKKRKTQDGKDEMDQTENEDDHELTIAERLKAMEQYNEHDETDDTLAKPPSAIPTTASLTTILTQCLRASDDDTFESVILSQTLPDDVIRKTLLQLDNDVLRERLGERLILKLGKTPARAKVLGTWLRLLIATSVNMGRGHVLVRVLPALRNLIGERMESMTDLMSLEGRLELVNGAQ